MDTSRRVIKLTEMWKENFKRARAILGVASMILVMSALASCSILQNFIPAKEEPSPTAIPPTTIEQAPPVDSPTVAAPQPSPTEAPTYTPFPTFTEMPTYTPFPTFTSLPTYTPYPTYLPLATYPLFPTYTLQPYYAYPTPYYVYPTPYYVYPTPYYTNPSYGTGQCCTLRVWNYGTRTYWIGTKMPYGGNYIKPRWYVEFYLHQPTYMWIEWCRLRTNSHMRYDCQTRYVYVDEILEQISVP